MTPKKLPSATPRNVLEVLQVLRRAPADVEFKQDYLRQQGLGQFKQALHLVRFLDLLSAVRRLKPEVLEARGTPARLAQLLGGRLQAGCRALGCSDEEVAFLGSEECEPAELDRRLRNLPPVKREKSSALRSNTVHCLQALHEALRTLGAELPAPAARRPASAPPPVGQALAELLAGRAKSFQACETIEEVIDYLPDHTAVRAHVTFDVPVEPAHLIRLAKLLLDRAAASQPVEQFA